MKYAPYSFSKIDMHSQCPKKFKYCYVDKIRLPWTPQIHFERGKYLHLMQEYQGDVSKVKAHSDYKKMKLMNPDIEQECNRIYMTFNDSKLGKWHKDIKHVADEVGIALDGKLQKADFMNYFDIAKFGTTNIFQGFIDRLSVIEEKDLLVVNDWKSGRYKEKPDFSQLLYYAIWAFDAVPYDNIMIMLSYLEHNKSHQKLLKREDLPKYKLALANDIKRIETDDIFQKNVCGLCNFCDYKPHCDKDINN